MSDTFKLGDLVQLKSGSPVMTVGEVARKGTLVGCYYFTPDLTLIEIALPSETLVRFELPKGVTSLTFSSASNC